MVSPPFWGAPTSYLNFCEEDYVITRYVAEFINTLSSFTYMIYGLYGLYHLHHNQKPNSTPRSIPYFGLIGVGICSAGYHMTLKYHTQMSDELSMHLLTTPLLYRILTFQSTPQRKKTTGVVLFTLFTIVMVVHMLMDEFVLHAVSFGSAVLVITVKTLRIIRVEIKDERVRGKVGRVALFGVGSFIFGYLVWLIDEFACGMWHVFTAIGGYIAVAIIDLITSGEVGRDSVGELAWPVAGVGRILGDGVSEGVEEVEKRK
ncbi:hypothetical protein BO94DRAFT_587532 [Aspergillus sclerotioniger CBS 115572]|uniref:Alkaline phytoceramidase n=1 Tax=Aspergillus sclerotioniger CBS 115572 TaxID=1450535 RepID=A0A317W700_9EURO|nr:hypothetical protein BO94DRAFT_587532 [Aspergillus sclerotioniger CBS 115572]PWY80788.1 hypothetical protein BO94DRAFT_587532 [Aspergillus sclerotioniger CBS 115572]